MSENVKLRRAVPYLAVALLTAVGVAGPAVAAPDKVTHREPATFYVSPGQVAKPGYINGDIPYDFNHPELNYDYVCQPNFTLVKLARSKAVWVLTDKNTWTSTKIAGVACRWDSKGAIGKLPAWFPKTGATKADIDRLGWTANTKVSFNLRLPQPVSGCTPAKLPDSYRLDKVDSFEGVKWVPEENGMPAEQLERGWANATWTLRGAQGLIYVGSWLGRDRALEWFSPAAYIRVAPDAAGDWSYSGRFPLQQGWQEYNHGTGVYDTHMVDIAWDVMDGMVPDCGQANLPSQVFRDWAIPRPLRAHQVINREGTGTLMHLAEYGWRMPFVPGPTNAGFIPVTFAPRGETGPNGWL